MKDEAKIADLVITIFRSNELLTHLTKVKPLYGVLQMKDELYTPINPYTSDAESNSTLLPLITFVIKNMQVL
mgnify:FL=1